MAIRLGDLLVRNGTITEAQRDAALDYQRLTARPLGEIVERLFGVSPSDVEDAWAEQYASMAPWVDPRDERVEPSALALVERRQAWQFRVLPLRFAGEEAVLCTTREHLVRALRFAGWRVRRGCYFVLSDPTNLGQALMTHYPMDGMTPEMVTAGRPRRAGRGA